MSKLRSKFITVLAVLILALLTLSTALFIPKNEKTAEAVGGNVGNLIASGTGNNLKFSGENLAALYANLTGDADKAVFSEVEKLVTGNDPNTGKPRTLSALQIRSNASGGAATAANATGEFTVNFAGKEWIPTYLSKDDNGNVILTLWLAQSSAATGDSSVGVKWTGHTTRYGGVADGCYPSGLYSSSYARAYMTGYNYSDSYTTLNGNGAAIQSAFWQSFVSDYGSYIVTPSTVLWQRKQSAVVDLLYSDSSRPAYVTPNESCEDPDVGGWATNNIGMTRTGSGTGAYYHWKNDKIWLPSMTEIGDTSGNIGIWKTSDNQLKNPGGDNTLTRSGGAGTCGNYFFLDHNGVWQTAGILSNVTLQVDITTLTGGIRPAFHLNLTAAKANVDKTALPVPSAPITTVYNGNERTLAGTDGLAAEDGDKAPWYYSSLYQASAANVAEGEQDSKTVKDAGNYTITLEIGNTTDYKWVGSTDLTKTFALTINAKKVKVKFVKQGTSVAFTNTTVTSGDTANYPDVTWFDTTQIASTDTEANGRLPKLKLRYQSTGSTNSIPAGEEYTAPIKKGTYRAYAELYYEDTDQPVNYVLDPDSTTYIDFTVKAVDVTKPTLGNTNLTYNGAEQTVTVSGLPANNSTTNETTVTYTVTKDGNIVEDSSNTPLENLTGTSFKVIDAGTYKVTFSIVSDKQNTHVWIGENNCDDLDGDEYTFTVAKKKLRLYFDGSSELSSGSWTVGTEINFSVNLNNDVCVRNGVTEQVALYVYYTDKNGNGSTEATDQGGYNYILPDDLVIGSNYKLYCKLAENEPVNDNYVIENNGLEADKIQKSFEITAADANFTANDLVWVYKNTEYGNTPQPFGTDKKVPYNTKTYTVSLDTSDFASKGVEIDTSYGTNGFDGETSAMNARATAYVVTVRIKASGDYVFEARTYTLEWYISPIDYDLSSPDLNIRWQYKARGNTQDYVDGAPYEGGRNAVNDGGKIEVFISGLPSEFTAVYAPQATYTYAAYDIGRYTAMIIELTSSDDNYKNITDFSSYSWNATLNWEIVKHVLDTNSSLWSQADYADGNVTEAPKLDTRPYNVELTYKYYDNAGCTGADIAFEDLEYAEGTEKTYYVKAFIKNAADEVNYELDNDGPYSNNPHGFVVGANRAAVKIEVSGGGMYDGTPQGVEIELIGTYEEELTLDAFEITYYNSEGGIMTGAPTNVGTYTVKIALKEEFTDRYFIKDYEDYTLEITTRILEVPTYAGSLTYNGEEQDIAKLVGLPDGWENYLEIRINGTASNGKVKDVGTYNFIFEIKNASSGNVAWNVTSGKTQNRTLTLTVNQLVLHAQKWSKNGYYTAIEFEEEDGDRFVTYTVKNANGEVVSEAEFYAHPDDEYVIEVSVAEEHGENVTIVYAAGVNPQLRFVGSSTDEGDAAELENAKNSAKEELEKEAQAKKDAIDADVNLSAEEKAAAKEEIDKELEEGKDAIDAATDLDGVNKALDDGKKEVDDTADLAQGKGAAKSELDKAAQAKKDAIDADPNLTDEEKAAAKAEVDKELEDGKKAIDNATDLSGVDTAESSTKANIENIKPEHVGGSFPWWILAVIAGALVLVTVLIIVIVKRRNADDDDGYDDFYDDEYDYDEEEEIDDDGDEAYDF